MGGEVARRGFEGLLHSTWMPSEPWQVRFVMIGASGGFVSVVTIRESEAGPSLFFVKALTTMRYFVNGP